MKRVLLLSLFGLLTYLLLLLTRAPAGLILGFIPDNADIHVQAPAGSLWNGRFSQLQAGPVAFQGVEWRLRPARLLLGRADIKLSGNIGRGLVEGRLIVNRQGEIRIPKALGQQLPLGRLAPLVGQPADIISGEGAFELRDALVRNGAPESGEADVRAFSLVLNMMGRQDLGSFAGELNGSGGEFSLDFRDVDEAGPFELSGEMELDTQRNRYQVNGRIRARDHAPENIASMLRYLGQADDNGRYPLRFSGRLR